MKDKQGFGTTGVLAVVIVLSVITFAGWVIAHKSTETNPTKLPQTDSSKPDDTSKSIKTEDVISDPYKGWETYQNDKYGFSFRYPSELKLDEVVAEAPNPSSATAQISAFNLKHNVNEKYSELSSMEILGKNLGEIEKWYDTYYGQSTTAKVSKEKQLISNKNAIKYTVINVDETSYLNLYEVGDYTYTFESLQLNREPSDRENYLKIVESLEIK